MDNCEHVLDAAAELVEAILARTKTVKVMATSREGLRVGGEHLWAVPSLGVDGDGSEAVELFVERAREVDASFSLDDEADVEAVSVICRRLDGIALAIELAAARMVSMSPAGGRGPSVGPVPAAGRGPARGGTPPDAAPRGGVVV